MKREPKTRERKIKAWGIKNGKNDLQSVWNRYRVEYLIFYTKTGAKKAHAEYGLRGCAIVPVTILLPRPPRTRINKGKV